MTMADNTYVWCTYRDWSFRILEGLQDLPGWKTGMIVTTPECRYDFSRLKLRGIPILRVNPKHDLKEGKGAYNAIKELKPATVFHNGWSWIVPKEFHEMCPNVVLHPGKLPKDRGGSPIQNQILNGETWTYNNLMEVGEGLDEGGIYCKKEISLEGEADDVWARMTATGLALSRDYLVMLAAGTACAEPQQGTPTVYKRVTPERSLITPGGNLTARQIYDIVRAHNETDPNTYIVPARVPVGKHLLIVDRASLDERIAQNAHGTLTLTPEMQFNGDDLATLCASATNGEMNVALQGSDGKLVYLTRFSVRAV
jgi:methionyl-tRNA formyltransferase